ncbi:MAG: sulfurtransferase [Desulfuromonas sp.]|nr:MAG: sulfurtransferase [Desulfuromonas sp.]
MLAKRSLLFALLVAFTFSATSAMAFGFGNKFEKEVETEQQAVKLTREVVRGGYGVVTTAELKTWIDEGKEMVIVDTMPFESSYKKAHVPGAAQFLFPIPDMNEWNSAETAGKSMEEYVQLLGPDKDKTIVVYCGFVKCTRSHNGAVWAKKLGYKNVYRYPGGIFAWQGAKNPIEKAE